MPSGKKICLLKSKVEQMSYFVGIEFDMVRVRVRVSVNRLSNNWAQICKGICKISSCHLQCCTVTILGKKIAYWTTTKKFLSTLCACIFHCLYISQLRLVQSTTWNDLFWICVDDVSCEPKIVCCLHQGWSKAVARLLLYSKYNIHSY